MTLDSAHQNYWQTADVVFGMPIVAAIGMQYLLPLALPAVLPRLVYIIAGAALIFAGLTLVVQARREFRRSDQPTDPGRPTTRIVTTGVYTWTRNPLYLGVALFVCGAGLVFDRPWLLAGLLVSLLVCQFFLILPEESYLEQKFGLSYRAYTARVPRWIGWTRKP